MNDNAFFAVVMVTIGVVLVALILSHNLAPSDLEQCGRACGAGRLARWSSSVFETKTPQACECVKPELGL